MASQKLQTDNMCENDPELPAKLKKFKFEKRDTTAAMILKINMAKETVEIEDTYEDITTEELMEELPERQPRYVIYSYKHTTHDNRVLYPLYFIYFKPNQCKAELALRYAGNMERMYNMSGAMKCLNLTEKDELTDEWIHDKANLK